MNPNTNQPKHLARLRGSRSVTMVTILEGRGVTDEPFVEVHYIVDKDGQIFGRVDREWRILDGVFTPPAQEEKEV